MKRTKSLFLMSAASLGGMLAMTSCASEEMGPVVSDGNVTFTVNLPELGTRYGEGVTANKLYVAVYSADGTELLMSNFPNDQKNASSITVGNNGGFAGKATTVTIPLVKNSSYKIAFWAQADGAPYTYSTSDKTIKVSYSGAEANDETRDAFFSYESVTADGSVHPVTLFRPFSQINIGTNDLDAAQKAGMTVTKAGMTISGVADTFDLVSGNASLSEGASGNVTFTATTLPATPNTFPVDNYDYLAMSYVLVPSTTDTPKATLNVGLLVNDGVTAFATYDNVPAQRNYRTNIYGSLLTNKEVFQVTINPIFEIPAYGEIPAEVNGVITLDTPEHLASFAMMVNNGLNDFSGKTVKLGAGIDLKNAAWTPVGTAEHPFAGTFDGNGQTISNLSVTGKDYAGLFGALSGTVKNLTVSNSNISSPKYAGVIAAYIPAGSNAAITDCTIEGGTATTTGADNGAVGGVVGKADATANTIKNVQLKNMTVAGVKNVGGTVGVQNGTTATISGNKLENVNLLQDFDGYTGAVKPGEFISPYNGGDITTYKGTATVDNTSSYTFKNWKVAGGVVDIQSAIERPMNIVIEKFECQSVRWVTAAEQHLTVTDCVFEGTTVKDGMKDNLEGVMKGSPASSLTVKNCNFKSAGRQNIIVFTDGSSPVANINITGCQFSNWGYLGAHGDPADGLLIAIKVADITGICYSAEDRANFSTALFNNNTFTAPTEAGGKPVYKLILTAPAAATDRVSLYE